MILEFKSARPLLKELGVSDPSPIWRFLTVSGLICLLGAPGWTAEPQAPKSERPAPQLHEPQVTLWRSTLTKKNQRRVLTRLDKLAVSYYLSEGGRWSKGSEYEYQNNRRAARYAARKILSSQLEIFKPDILETWKETAVGLRSKVTHEGEIKDPKGPIDFDIGLRSGKPFLGTNIARTRIVYEWDVRRDQTKLKASRTFGIVGTNLEFRRSADDGDEFRINVNIPVSW